MNLPGYGVPASAGQAVLGSGPALDCRPAPPAKAGTPCHRRSALRERSSGPRCAKPLLQRMLSPSPFEGIASLLSGPTAQLFPQSFHWQAHDIGERAGDSFNEQIPFLLDRVAARLVEWENLCQI